MAVNDKMQAIHKLQSSIGMMADAYATLGDKYDDAVPSLQSDIAVEMAVLNAELTASKVFLSHLQAAASEVSQPTPESYSALSAGLGALQEMKKATVNLQKLLQLANALAGRAASTRKEVSGRTT
jgi:3-deoxy-D-manno-octulosonate 8-phosphate phosphatase KdsC-like HAD superfamily phosphatase